MKASHSLTLDTERDADIIDRITWLKKNKPGGVAGWLRDMIRAGMQGESEVNYKLDRIIHLLESGAVVSSGPAEQQQSTNRVSALDKLGV